MRKLSIDIKQSICKSVCYLVSKIVNLATLLDIRSCSLFLEELDSLVEDLQCWRSWSLNGILSAQKSGSPPAER
jgi:hypothetical protein